MKRTLPPESLQGITTRLEQAHNVFQRRYPGAGGARQPIHAVYGGAHPFRADTAKRLGELAIRSLDEFAPDFVSFARAIALPAADRLPESPEAAAAVGKSIEADPEAARKEKPACLDCTHGVSSHPREAQARASGRLPNRFRRWLRESVRRGRRRPCRQRRERNCCWNEFRRAAAVHRHSG